MAFVKSLIFALAVGLCFSLEWAVLSAAASAQEIRHVKGASSSDSHSFLMSGAFEKLHELTLVWDFSLTFQIDGETRSYTMADIDYIRRTVAPPVSQKENWYTSPDKGDFGIDIFLKDGGRVHLFRRLEGATLEMPQLEGVQGFFFDDEMVRTSSDLLEVHPSKTQHDYIHVTGLSAPFYHHNRMSREGLYRSITEEFRRRTHGLQMGVHRGKTCQGLLTPFLVIDGGRE